MNIVYASLVYERRVGFVQFSGSSDVDLWVMYGMGLYPHEQGYGIDYIFVYTGYSPYFCENGSVNEESLYL